MERRTSGSSDHAAVPSILDLLLPPRCPGCGREGEILCAGCYRSLERRIDEPSGVPIGLAAALPP
ncbi:MAG: double zinc ribbon domain-containing protein, partial [Candidatus Limnocylindrales bacterium]